MRGVSVFGGEPDTVGVALMDILAPVQPRMPMRPVVEYMAESKCMVGRRGGLWR